MKEKSKAKRDNKYAILTEGIIFNLNRVIELHNRDILASEFMKITLPTKSLERLLTMEESLLRLNPPGTFTKRELNAIKKCIVSLKILKKINLATERMISEGGGDKDYLLKKNDKLEDVLDPKWAAEKYNIPLDKIKGGMALNFPPMGKLKFSSWKKAIEFVKSEKYKNLLKALKNKKISKSFQKDFKNARNYVQRLGLRNKSEWKKAIDLNLISEWISKKPEKDYVNDWIDFDDWLGVKKSSKKSYHTFEDARKFVRVLEIANKREWDNFMKSDSYLVNVPKNPEIVYKKKWKGYSDWLGIGNQEDSQKEADKLLDEAIDVSEKDPSKGLKKINEFLSLYPDDRYGLLNKGVILGELGKFNEAIKYFDKCLIMDKNDFDALFEKGNALLDLEKIKESLKCFLATKKLEPKNVDVHINIAYAYLNLKEIKKAMNYCKYALTIDPKNYDLMHNLAECYAARDRMKEALVYIKKILKHERTWWDTWFLLSVCNAKLKKKEFQVLDPLLVAISLSPKKTKERLKEDKKIFESYRHLPNFKRIVK